MENLQNILKSDSKIRKCIQLIKESKEIKKENPQLTDVQCRILAKERN
jgi:hypothetical protein